MNEDKKRVQGPEMKVNLPANQPILYTDSVFISSNQYGLVFNVAQTIDETNQQIVVRIGMSKDHARALADVLAKHVAIISPNPTKN